jgi:arylsulfatase A-like enzyme
LRSINFPISRHFLAVLLLLSAGAAPLAAAAPAPIARPNIILIFADDLGWRDVGWQGSDFYETPNLDKLAASGMVFSNAYAAAGNCAPSRACLLSGNYTPRHHVYAVKSTDRGPKNASRLVPIPNRSGLAKDNVTVADALKAAGYATGIFGKWHLDGPEGAEPGEQGFDTVHQSYHTWSDAKADEPQNPKGIFSLTRGAMGFMERNRDRPFFLYLPHYAIHTVHQARPETLARFQKKKPGAQHSDPLYAACLYDLDAGIGQLLEKLAALGLEENTLVVFTSDNGGTQKSSQEPLRGNKGGYYEGGIREPFIASWPAAIKSGSRSDVPVISVDLFPTFLAAAGAPVPAGKVLDGESLLPLFRGTGPLARQSIFWHFPGYLGGPVIRGRDLDVRTSFRSRPVSVIRQGDWKLHVFHEEWVLDGGRAKLATNKAVELYNLADDLGERHDLAQKEPARRDALLNDLFAWIKHTGAILPSQPNPAYDPATAQTQGAPPREPSSKQGVEF